MLKTLRFLLALAAALLIMLAIRAFAFTICTVEGEGLSPLFCSGDRVLVNRWSYGLRVGSDEGLFGYTRIARQPVERGDIVAFENPRNTSEVLIARCKAVPGDMVTTDGTDGHTAADGNSSEWSAVVPGRVNCAEHDSYWMEAIGPANTLDSRSLGFIPEQLIIGRVTAIVYSHDPAEPFWRGWRHYRLLLKL